MKKFRIGALLSALILFSPQLLHADETVAVPRSDHASALEEIYSNWLEVTNSRDIEAWTSFLAPNAIFLPPNSPLLSTKEQIRNYYIQLFEDDRFHLSCRQEHIEVSKSEDMAWSSGHCEGTFTDSSGNEAHGRSKWAKVWKRTPNAEWKCAVNSWSSTDTN